MMKTTSCLLVAIVLASIVTLAGSWNPSVAAVPVTAPWDSMNLPVKEDARVWGSTPIELKVAHKDGKTMEVYVYDFENTGVILTLK